MRLKVLVIGIAATLFAACASAQDITGTILIKKRLTRPSVSAPVSVYQRGITVKLGGDAEQDPLAYERSRVVVYLEAAAALEAASGPNAAGAAVPDASAKAEPKPEPAEQVEQLDRRFVPDLVVVPVGSTVSFPNMDPIFHNIYSLSRAKTFDLGSYDKGETRRVIFPKAGIVEVYCHLHPNMAATVVVTPNRWYARPDRAGHYRIADVPPGKYTVVAWHKSAGFYRKSIVVEQGRDPSIDFLIPIDVDPRQDAQANQSASEAGGSH